MNAGLRVERQNEQRQKQAAPWPGTVRPTRVKRVACDRRTGIV